MSKDRIDLIANRTIKKKMVRSGFFSGSSSASERSGGKAGDKRIALGGDSLGGYGAIGIAGSVFGLGIKGIQSAVEGGKKLKENIQRRVNPERETSFFSPRGKEVAQIASSDISGLKIDSSPNNPTKYQNIAQGKEDDSDFDSHLKKYYGLTKTDKIWRNMPGHLKRDIRDGYRDDIESGTYKDPYTNQDQSSILKRAGDFVANIVTPKAVAGTLEGKPTIQTVDKTNRIFSLPTSASDMFSSVGAAVESGGVQNQVDAAIKSGGVQNQINAAIKSGGVENQINAAIKGGGVFGGSSSVRVLGRKQPRVASPMESGMGFGAVKARKIAKENIAKGGVARGRAAARSKAQSAAKARKKAGQTVSGVNARNRARMRSRARARNAASKRRRRSRSRGRSRCDLRCKLNISLLTSMNLMRDDLAEVAYFVKELQEIN